jgi:cytochrome c-type biogenesis protein CcmH
MACKSAEQLTFEASQYVDQGMGKDAILAAFVQKYGEQILAAPTKRGFNLTAWILPFVGLIAGAFGIVIILKKWVKRQKKASPKMTRLIDAASGESSAYESELDVVLKQLD